MIKHTVAIAALGRFATVLTSAATVKTPLFPPASREFLRAMTRDVVQAARVRPGASRGGSVANTTGETLLMPGGNYPAFWIRDFAMSLDAGFITPEELRHHLRLTAQGQNGPVERRLKNGLVIPPFAIPDHILFDGQPSFYPGSYGTGDDQGNGTFGQLPPIDDHYEFIHIAHRYYLRTRQAAFLKEAIGGIPLWERLWKAFDAPAADTATGLTRTAAGKRAVGFGFCDSIYFTGKLLFPSLLRYRAAGQLIELGQAAGRRERNPGFKSERAKIRRSLVPTFGDPARLGGWLMAASEVGRQADVWGTLYALHLGVLTGRAARQARQTIAADVEKITCEGAVRHVPTHLDATSASAWEKAACPHNTYQNGAYWHTPTGWLIEALLPFDKNRAGDLFRAYIDHLRRGDYRLGNPSQAPWECFGRNGVGAQNGVYMTSVALPWSILQALANSHSY